MTAHGSALLLDINDDNFAIGLYEMDGKIVIEKMK